MTKTRWKSMLLAAGCLGACSAAWAEFPVEWTEKFAPRNQCVPACAPQWGFHATSWRPWNADEVDYQPRSIGSAQSEIYDPALVPHPTSGAMPGLPGLGPMPNRYGAPPPGTFDVPPTPRPRGTPPAPRGTTPEQPVRPRGTRPAPMSSNGSDSPFRNPDAAAIGALDAGSAPPTRFLRDRTPASDMGRSESPFGRREIPELPERRRPASNESRAANQSQLPFAGYSDDSSASEPPPRAMANQTVPPDSAPFGYSDEAPLANRPTSSGEAVHWNGTRRVASSSEKPAATARRSTAAPGGQWPPVGGTGRDRGPLRAQGAWPAAADVRR